MLMKYWHMIFSVAPVLANSSSRLVFQHCLQCDPPISAGRETYMQIHMHIYVKSHP